MDGDRKYRQHGYHDSDRTIRTIPIRQAEAARASPSTGHNWSKAAQACPKRGGLEMFQLRYDT